MLDPAPAAAPEGKRPTDADYEFLHLFEQRQGALAFIAVASSVIYGLTLPLADRHTLHLVFSLITALYALMNADHACVPFLGHHPRVSRNGRHVGIDFAPFSAAADALNYLGFSVAAV